jgi:hypothetical protein
VRAASGLTPRVHDAYGRRTQPDQGYINHVALVLDESASMRDRRERLVEVVDAEIKNLAQQSTKLGQETRITVYAFADDVRCLVFDRDVLRLPSIAEHYRPSGMTALLDATAQSVSDLEQTCALYGDHAFLVYVFTDGAENRSHRYTPATLQRRLCELPENWTVACFVPDEQGRQYVKSFGFPEGNVAVWDATTDDGVSAGVSVMSAATQSYMTSRATGVRGTKTLFAGGEAQVNAQARAAAGLKALPREKYTLLPVDNAADPLEIRPFVEHSVGTYVTGRAFYELTKPEKIQPQKQLAVRDRKSGRVYTGRGARDLLNLPDHEVRVKPEANGKYQIFVQSTSVNRKLVPGTRLLLLLEDVVL